MAAAPVDNMKPVDNITREELHFRRLDFRGWRRSDGLFEVEARLLDSKPHDFAPPSGSRVVPANEAIHDLGLRLVFDEDLVVQAVSSFVHAFPYPPCPRGGDSLQALVGLRIGAGWSTAVRQRLPASETCAHLREILVPLASAVMQSMNTRRMHLLDATDASGKPLKVDSCYAYGATRELVLQRWPAYHRAAPPEA